MKEESASQGITITCFFGIYILVHLTESCGYGMDNDGRDGKLSKLFWLCSETIKDICEINGAIMLQFSAF